MLIEILRVRITLKVVVVLYTLEAVPDMLEVALLMSVMQDIEIRSKLENPLPTNRKKNMSWMQEGLHKASCDCKKSYVAQALRSLLFVEEFCLQHSKAGEIVSEAWISSKPSSSHMSS